jgi:hypothetical protein
MEGAAAFHVSARAREFYAPRDKCGEWRARSEFVHKGFGEFHCGCWGRRKEIKVFCFFSSEKKDFASIPLAVNRDPAVFGAARKEDFLKRMNADKKG